MTTGYIVKTENGRESIQVSTSAEAMEARTNLERRYGKTVIILPVRKEISTGVL